MSESGKSIFEEGQILLFYKPIFWTSFDLVNKVRLMIRSNLGIKKIKVGHAGTLDPLATGLLIICTGNATKRIEEFRDLDKEYLATVSLGATTPSFDLETEVDMVYPTGHITPEKVHSALEKFKGEIYQVPPVYSAKFIDGKRAYEYARKGEMKEMKPVKVNFREVELVGYRMPELKIRLLCSKGTFIRSFAKDLGEALESGAYLSALERLSIGNHHLSEATDIEKFGLLLQQMKQN